jgi:hypothetical protein
MRTLSSVSTILLLVTITFALGCAAPQKAPKVCPEGKTAITKTNPGGKSTTICVAESAAPAECPCFAESEAAAILAGSEYRYNNTLWQGGDGTADACESVVIQRDLDFLGAMTTPSNPGVGCITTQDYPTESLGTNGCVLRRHEGQIVILNQLSPEESAACVTVLKIHAL